MKPFRKRFTDAWAAFRGAEESRASGTNSHASTGFPLPTGAEDRKRPSDEALLCAYRGLMWALANINARAVARVPLRLYVVTAKGQARPRSVATRAVSRATHRRLAERVPHVARQLARSAENVVEEIVEHPVLTALRQPAAVPHSPFKGARSLTYFAQVGKEILGQSFWRYQLDNLGMPREILPLPPACVTPVFFPGPRVDGRFVDYFAGPDGEHIPADRVAWFRFLDLRDPYGAAYSPAAAAFAELGLIDRFDDAAGATFDRAFHPDAIVSPKNPDRPLGQGATARLEADLEKKFGKTTRALGKRRGNNVIIADGAVEYDPWESPRADGGAVPISKGHRQTAANIFDVPMTMIETSTSNKASAEAGNAAHLTNAVAPRCELLGEELTAWMHDLGARDTDPTKNGPNGWDRAFLAFDDPSPIDEEAKARVLVSLVGRPILLPDEARAELDYGPMPDGKGMEAAAPTAAPGDDKPPAKAKAKPTPDDDEDDDE